MTATGAPTCSTSGQRSLCGRPPLRCRRSRLHYDQAIEQCGCAVEVVGTVHVMAPACTDSTSFALPPRHSLWHVGQRAAATAVQECLRPPLPALQLLRPPTATRSAAGRSMGACPAPPAPCHATRPPTCTVTTSVWEVCVASASAPLDARARTHGTGDVNSQPRPTRPGMEADRPRSLPSLTNLTSGSNTPAQNQAGGGVSVPHLLEAAVGREV